MDKKRDETKAVIWKVALVLLIQKGFKDVTVKGICEVAGLSRGRLYTRYGNTGQVLANIIDELMSGLKGQVAERMERDLPAALTLGELLEHYQSEVPDRSGPLGLAFYEYYSNMSLLEDNAVLKQYYISETMLCSLVKYGIDKGESKQASVNAVAGLLLSSCQGVRMLSSIMPLGNDSIPKGMISEIRAILVK